MNIRRRKKKQAIKIVSFIDRDITLQ